MSWNQKSVRLSAATLVGGVAFTVACLFTGPSAPTHAAGNSTQDATKQLFLEKCSGCHEAPDPQNLEYSPQKWRATVDRMLNKHNARTSISDDEANQIVAYLAKFAPRPLGPNDPSRNVTASAWNVDPVASRNYTFADADQLSSFEKVHGEWTFVPSPDTTGGFIKTVSTANAASALLIESKTPVSGDLDLRTQFRARKGTAGIIGLVANYQGPKDYLVARYDTTANTVALIRYSQGQATVVGQATLTDPLAPTPDGWHDLRVKSFGNGRSVEVWLDYVRQTKAADNGWQTNGRVGLDVSGDTVAAFRLMSIDVYPTAL